MTDVVDHVQHPTGAARTGRRRRASWRGSSRVKDSPWVERASRLGHVAKGASYAPIAVLALQVTFGHRSRT
jgi:hypothetical protein